jgi:hypothetical protein
MDSDYSGPKPETSTNFHHADEGVFCTALNVPSTPFSRSGKILQNVMPRLGLVFMMLFG